MVITSSGRSLSLARRGITASLLLCGKDINLVLSVLLDEVGKVFDSPCAGILNGRVFGTGREQLDGREASNRVRNIVRGGIDLGDGDLGVNACISIETGKLVILRRETIEEWVRQRKLTNVEVYSDGWRESLRFAVSTPGCVEFKKDILLIVNDNVLVRMRHDNSDWAFLGLGNRLRLNARLRLAIKNVLDKFADVLDLELFVLVIGVLGMLLGVLDGKGWKFLRVQVEVSSVGTKQLSIDCGNVDSSLVLLGNRLEVLGELIALFLGFGENVCQWDTGLKSENTRLDLPPFPET